MAVFKHHCTFGFWKASLMPDPHGLLTQSEAAMGQFGQIKSAEDLPPRDVLIAYIKEAVRLNEEGVKVASRPRTAGPKELTVPDYFTAALKENPQASETFENFRHSHRKEYVEWVREARTEETRNRRMATAVEWLAEGKAKNWKYAVK